MRFLENELYHVYNRGNNKQTIFFTQENYRFFLRKIRENLFEQCDILAYCLMPNHYHILIQPSAKGCAILDSGQTTPSRPTTTTIQPLARKIAVLQSSYTRAIQKQQEITGSLFQQKTKAKLIEPFETANANAAAICMHYIHQNPVKAGLVSKMEDYEFSSFRDYARIRKGTLCNQKLAFELTGISPERFVSESYGVIPDGLVEKIAY